MQPSPPSRPYTLQPNANLLEICYKDRIQQFDDDEEEEDGQGSGESDGEDGTWQGSSLARGPRLGVPPGMRSGGSTDSEEDEEDEEDVEEEGQAVCGGAGPPSHSSVSPQSLGR